MQKFSTAKWWIKDAEMTHQTNPRLDTWLEEDENADTIDNTGEDDAVALAPAGENDDQQAAMALLDLVATMSTMP